MLGIVSEIDFEKEIIASQVPTLVAFFATWCAPCKMIAPILSDLAGEFGDKVKIVKIDVDEARNTAKAYGVRGVPNLVFFKDGEVVDRVTGVLPKAELAAKITNWI
ncbi:MAG: thioredoxin [Clostridiales bacterium]|nr:thioredoxin [Clostridiales bacterium]